jgi:hypothetical protein
MAWRKVRTSSPTAPALKVTLLTPASRSRDSVEVSSETVLGS